MKSSQRAFDLIVSEEDSDQAYYVTHYEHFDWPQGASGPTIAIGYDCGYVGVQEARDDWSGIVDDDTIDHIVRACGLRGEAAHAFVQAHRASVTITWEQAIKEFGDREMPKWEDHVTRALPNTDLLSPDSFGALDSLAYNRGASFNLPGPRFAEMRAIKAHMQAGELDKIPDEFLSMRRLWPKGGDLWRRRGHEADLFRAGLGLPATGTPRPGPPMLRPVPRTTANLQRALNVLLKLSPPLDDDGVYGDKTTAAVEQFQTANSLDVDGDAGDATWSQIELQPNPGAGDGSLAEAAANSDRGKT